MFYSNLNSSMRCRSTYYNRQIKMKLRKTPSTTSELSEYLLTQKKNQKIVLQSLLPSEKIILNKPQTPRCHLQVQETLLENVTVEKMTPSDCCSQILTSYSSVHTNRKRDTCIKKLKKERKLIYSMNKDTNHPQL